MATLCKCLQPLPSPTPWLYSVIRKNHSACSAFIIGFQSIFWTQSRHYSPIFTMKLRVLNFFPTHTCDQYSASHILSSGTWVLQFLQPIKTSILGPTHKYFYLEDKSSKLFNRNKHFNLASNLHYATFSVSVLAACLKPQ